MDPIIFEGTTMSPMYIPPEERRYKMGKGNGKSGDGNNTGKKLENLLGKIPRDDYPPEMLEKRRSAYQEQIRDINANIGEGGSDEGKSCWDAIFPSLLLLVTGLGLLSHYI